MTEDNRIKQLDPTTVQRIAAGEVVERPASVVKELVENSLDADASRIEVEIERGGTEHIRVADDGIGMTETDAREAVKKHTTSKIADIDDLESGVATLGFRGEALHTVGAVSRTTITTKPREGDGGRGTELQVVGGNLEEVSPAGCPVGTAVEVTDLFFNTPARRKYLKADATEFSHVNRVVTHYALANPDVAVSLEHDGNRVFATTGQGDLQGAILSVYGKEVARSMIEVEYDGASGPEGPLEGASGYVSDPETTRSTREYVSTYVNGRYVTAAAVREAVVSAYGNQLAPDRYPFAILELALPPETVDVNVHPRKMEVRFGDEPGVRAQVREAVERALLDHGLVRSSAPRGRSAPDETPVVPDVGEQSELDADSEGASSESASRTDAESARTSPDSTGRSSPEQSSGGSSRSPAGTSGERAQSDRESASTNADSRSDAGPTRDSRNTDRSPERKFEGATRAGTLDDGEAFDAEFETLPSMQVLGQLQDTYVVAETRAGLILIDQHAADERINYERLCAELADDPASQVLAEPVALELTAGEAAVFEDYQEALASVGFYASRADDRTVAVETVPAVLSESLDPDLLRDALAAFVAGEGDAAETVEAKADGLLSDLACYPSITGNTSLTEGSVVDLLSALDDCENPYACPHGRPVVVEFGTQEIEDRFERDYPGHAGRRSED
jgi:DNA mismatch repair protein MutL